MNTNCANYLLDMNTVVSDYFRTITKEYQTFYGYETIMVPFYYDGTKLEINCNTKPELKCILKYKKKCLCEIDWEGPHQKPLTKISYRIKDQQLIILKEEYYYKGMGTVLPKEILYRFNIPLVDKELNTN